MEARLRGYRGGEGLIQIVQKKGQTALAYIVMDGMKQNTVSQIRQPYIIVRIKLLCSLRN